MDAQTQKNTDNVVEDILLERPHELSVETSGERETFVLYPVTLAKTVVLGRIMAGLPKFFSNRDPHFECLRLASESKEQCCNILAVHITPNDRRSLFDSQGMENRRGLMRQLSVETIATLLMHVLTADKTDEAMHQLGLDAEHERMRRVIEVKNKRGNSTLTFGGKTLFGGFIGQLKEMGYSDDEIIYERSYSYLRLMLADKVTSVYMNDDELNSIPTSMGGNMMDANDPAMKAKIRQRLGL